MISKRRGLTLRSGHSISIARLSVAIVTLGVLSGCGSATSTVSGSAAAVQTAISTNGLASISRKLLPPASDFRDYRSLEETNLSAHDIASLNSDPSLEIKLGQQGFLSAARITFVDPGRQKPAPFASVIINALVFTNDNDASGFFHDEIGRRSVPQNGTQLNTVAGIPQGGMDQLQGFSATASATTPTTDAPATQAFLVVMRQGTNVMEIFATGTTPTANLNNFIALVDVQEEFVDNAAAPS